MRSQSFSLVNFLAASALLTSPSYADVFSPSVTAFCNRKSEAKVERVAKDPAPEGFSDLPTNVLDQDFRTAQGSVPWSKATLYEDPVTGHYVAVSDRNYTGGNVVFTLWSRDLIRAGGRAQLTEYSAERFEFDTLMIPAGNSYLVLRGCDGRFPVNAQVADALRTMPKGKKVFVKLYAENWGDPVLTEIGQGTVDAWKRVYANWTRTTPPKVDDLGF